VAQTPRKRQSSSQRVSTGKSLPEESHFQGKDKETDRGKEVTKGN